MCGINLIIFLAGCAAAIAVMYYAFSDPCRSRPYYLDMEPVRKKKNQQPTINIDWREHDRLSTKDIWEVISPKKEIGYKKSTPELGYTYQLTDESKKKRIKERYY